MHELHEIKGFISAGGGLEAAIPLQVIKDSDGTFRDQISKLPLSAYLYSTGGVLIVFSEYWEWQFSTSLKECRRVGMPVLRTELVK